jgi:hypothetical protein
MFPLVTIVAAVAAVPAAAPAPVHPFLDSNVGCLLGGARGKEWVANKVAAAGLRGGETYKIVTAGGVTGTATGTAVQPTGEPCPQTLMVNLAPKPKDAPPYMAVTGDWDPMPRKATDLLPAKDRYLKLFAPMLATKKVRAPARIQQLWRVDLDGDGKDEVVAVLSNFSTRAGIKPGASAYSAVMVRRVAGTGVETHLVDFDQARKDHEPTELTVPLFLDLNGDGELEMVVYGAAGDGHYTMIFDLQDIVTAKGGKGGQALMGCSCGD